MTQLRFNKPLPLRWNVGTVIFETDIKVNSGRLRCKLLVFRNTRDMQRVWRTIGGSPLHPRTRGVVNGLSRCVTRLKPQGIETRRIECDRRYFCMMGLTLKHLTMEVIAHESVHVAYAWLKRRTRSWWDALAEDFDEESIAYPAGRIAAAINRVIHAAGLYPAKRSKKGRSKGATHEP